MTSGVVNANLEPIIEVRVRGPNGEEQVVRAIVDTGFDGALTLPPPLISALGLPWRRRGRALLADGHESIFDVYEASLGWDGAERRISVDEAEVAPLVGTALLENHELRIAFVDKGAVTITALQIQ